MSSNANAKRRRGEDGSRERDGASAGDVRELRDAIIHCDGSMNVLRGLSKDVARDVPVLCDEAKNFVIECVTELPVKTPAYATLVGLINAEAPEFGESVVRTTMEVLSETLKAEDLSARVRARILTRFVVMLSTVGVVKIVEAIGLLENMLTHALAQAKGGSVAWQPRADWIAYIALAALPWGGEFFSKSDCANEFENLLDLADAYARQRAANPDSATTIIKSAEGKEIDWFMEMHARLSAARTNGQWNILSIPAIAEPFVEALAQTSNAHALPMIEIATIKYANHAEASAHYPGRSILRILDTSFTEGTGNKDAWGPLERFVAEEYIVDTIWAFEPGYRRAAVIPATEQLASLPLPSEHPEQCQFMVAETLFAELLALPKSTFTPVFYHIIIQDLCKIIPTFPPKMAKTVGAMFRAIDRMDVVARDRLSDWLANQISCFDLVWPWPSWKHVMEQSDDAPQRMFVREVLRKLCQLSFVDRVKTSLIEELHPLLPANAGINEEYLRMAAQEPVCGEIQSMLAAKQEGPQLLRWLRDQGYAKASAEVLLRSLAVAVIERGQKCITHHDVLLKRYALALRELVDTVGGEVLVDAVAGMWRGHPQMAPIAVERLLALELVRPEAVVNWLLQSATAFGEGDTYEIAEVVCGFVCANKAEAMGRRQALLNKLRAAEAEAAGAGAAAEDLAAQGRHFEAQHAQTAEANAVEEIAVHQAALETADEPVERSTEVVREVCSKLCGGLVRGVSSGASVTVADRVLALVRSHRAELALDAESIVQSAGTKKAAQSAVAAALGVPL